MRDIEKMIIRHEEEKMELERKLRAEMKEEKQGIIAFFLFVIFIILLIFYFVVTEGVPY